MHRLFQVREMVLRILTYLYPGDKRWDWVIYWKDGRALVRFALTCRAMLDIALPLIWRYREDFMHLIELLPRHLHDFHVLIQMDDEDIQRDLFVSAALRVFNFFMMANSQCLKVFEDVQMATITKDDWERFDFYAPHMRQLRVISRNGYYQHIDYGYAAIEMDSFHRLIQQARRSHSEAPLTPNLRALHIQLDIHNVDSVQPFLSETLLHLNLFFTLNSSSVHAWPKHFKSLSRALDVALETCITLESLCLAWHYPRLNGRKRDALFSVVSPLLPNFKALRSLNLCSLPVNPSIMLVLTQLQNLRRLEVDVTSYPSYPEHPYLFFRNLEEFVMESYYLDSCNVFPLRKLCSPDITLIKAGSLRTPTPRAILDLFEALLCFKDLLLSVEICWLDRSIAELDVEGGVPLDPLLLLDLHIFDPLFQCGKLRDIRVNAYCSFGCLDNTFLERIGCTWPELEVLDLGSHSGSIIHPNITIQGLESLVGYCTSLRHVGVGTKFLDSLYRLGYDEPPLSSPSVKRLALGSRSLTMTSQYYRAKSARYLKALFPALETLEYGDKMKSWREAGGREAGDLGIECVLEENPVTKRWEGVQFHHYEKFDYDSDLDHYISDN